MYQSDRLCQNGRRKQIYLCVTNSGTVFPTLNPISYHFKKFGLNMNIFFECDHYKFLGYLESCEIFDEELMGLISNYKNLVFSQKAC